MKCITSVMTAVITAAVGKMQQLDDWRWWCRNNSIIPGHLLAQRAYYTLCILFEYGAFTQPWIKSCCIFIEVVRLSGGCGEIAFVARLITWSEPILTQWYCETENVLFPCCCFTCFCISNNNFLGAFAVAWQQSWSRNNNFTWFNVKKSFLVFWVLYRLNKHHAFH